MRALFLSILLFACVAPQQVTPLFACWFPSYAPGARLTNVVFSYNNTTPEEIIAPVAQDGSNTLTPYNGAQSDILKAGLNEYQFSVADTMGTLAAPGGQIVWQLLNSTLVVNASDVATSATQCAVVANGSCSMSIAGFCEDGSYCDGAETCAPVVVFAQSTDILGVCAGAARGVQCPGTQVCSEQALGCVAPPTAAPNSAAPSRAPTPEATVVPPVVIIPSFYCWFETQDALVGAVLNVAFSYDNTGPMMVMRPVTFPAASQNASTRNYVTPVDYNGLQTTLFNVGYEPLCFVVRDGFQVLRQGGAISWFLTTQSLVVTLAGNILDETQCSIVLPPQGEEEDDEEVSPTAEGGAGQCSAQNTDCTAYNTFCGGPTQCDPEEGACVLVDPSYSPCDAAQSLLPQGSPLEVLCVEHLGLCVAVANCTVDAECNDGLLCNGREYCANGTCTGPQNLTIEQLCGTAQAVCIEGEGCVATGTSPETTVAIVVGVFIAAAVLLGLVAFYFYANSAGGGGGAERRKWEGKNKE